MAKLFGLLIVAGALLAAGCTSEKVVYKDRGLFQQPATSALNFVGYTDSTTKLTVCGNCHKDHQASWLETKHATAWADLQASGHATSACEGCHTVNQNGNWVNETAGFLADNDPRYHDVQCEACHGPGLDHVSNPESTQPLAPLNVGTNTGCGECHQGAPHHPFVEEWSQSAHGLVPDAGHTWGNASCIPCHTGDGALQAWGVQTRFLEQDSLAASGGHLAITCAVCHDPHSDANQFQLRFAISNRTVEGNTCAVCHHKRGNPDPSTYRGPHSPEGPTLFGTAGWWGSIMKAEYPSGQVVATHGSDANAGTCATCHMAAGSGWTGHLFIAIPCTDTAGVPTSDESCGLQARDFSACAAGGCHGSGDVARSLMINAETRIDDLANELNALIAKIPSTEFVSGDDSITTGEGALFNYELATKPGSVVHNPFLVEALLTASIKQVEQDYNLAPVTNVSLDNLLQQTR